LNDSHKNARPQPSEAILFLHPSAFFSGSVVEFDEEDNTWLFDYGGSWMAGWADGDLLEPFQATCRPEDPKVPEDA
jgi:hypothetical protein